MPARSIPRSSRSAQTSLQTACTGSGSPATARYERTSARSGATRFWGAPVDWSPIGTSLRGGVMLLQGLYKARGRESLGLDVHSQPPVPGGPRGDRSDACHRHAPESNIGQKPAKTIDYRRGREGNHIDGAGADGVAEGAGAFLVREGLVDRKHV